MLGKSVHALFLTTEGNVTASEKGFDGYVTIAT